jgi:hypothetical protein
LERSVKRVLPFAIPFAAIVAAGIGASLIVGRGEPPCTVHVAVPVDALDPELDGCVATAGQAHYEAVIQQTFGGGLFGEDQHKYLFPLMPAGNTEEREVRVLVLTERAPERLVAYEQMELTGRVVRATPERVPYSAEIQLGKAGGYFFTDDMVVVLPDRITSDGEVWVPSP